MLVDEGLEIIDEEVALRLLAMVPVGRVAVSIGALPAVFPVNFCLVGRDIVFRTGAGTKLDRAVRNAVVAFEADAFDDTYREGWSVLAVGLAEEVTDGTLPATAARMQPWADGDRQHYVRIPIDHITGRRIVHDPVS